MGVFEIGRAIWGRFAATAHVRVRKIKKIKNLKKGDQGQWAYRSLADTSS